MPDPSVQTFLERAHEEWVSNPPPNQSPNRTRLYQEAVRDCLAEAGFNVSNLALDRPVAAVFDKNYDLVYTPYGVPRLAVSFKIIPLHELSAHARSRLEEATGDAANIHMQFPDLVLGYLWVLAIDPGKHVAEADWKNLRQALTFLARLTGRPGPDSAASRYEAVGVFPCSWARSEGGADHQATVKKVVAQVPKLLTPDAMLGLLLANYRLRFGELHEQSA